MTRDFLQTVERFALRWVALLAPILLILLWEALVRGSVKLLDLTLWEFEPVLDPAFFARPTEIWPELQRLYEEGGLIADVWDTTVRVSAGFAVGALPAIVLGLVMGASPIVRALLSPLAEALYAIPKIALLPLILFIYGTGEEAMVNIVALSVFFLMLLSVYKGVMQIDPKLYDVARSFGANPLQRFFSVTIPASMPTIVTSIQLGMGFALVVIVGSEFLSGGSGIGNLIWQAQLSFSVVEMFAGLVVIGVMGYVLALILQRAGQLLLPWQPQPRRQDPTQFQQMLQRYWIALRPWSFTATYAPILVGSAVAGYQGVTVLDDWAFNWLFFALALIGAVAFQAGTNLINDYYDHIKGADSEESLGIGGVIQRGIFSPRFVLAYGVFCFALGSVIGLYFVQLTDEFILFIGVFSLLAGFFYTAGPVALAYIGLGEVTVAVFMGPIIVLGANYVQTETIALEPIVAAIPIGLLAAAILHANNIRDIESDKQIGKRTLATSLGEDRAIIEYYILTLGAYATLLLTVIVGWVPPHTLIVFITLPSAAALAYRVATKPSPQALNSILRKTAQLHFRFGLLLTVGWFYATIFEVYQA